MKTILALIFSGLLAHPCLGMVAISDEWFKAAEVVAIIRVSSTTPSTASSNLEILLGKRNKEGFTPLSPPKEEEPKPTKPAGVSFRRTATVTVVTPVRGVQAGATLELAFDNGLVCPNVSYVNGEQCLVFLRKMKDGKYATIGLYAGKFQADENKVAGIERITGYNELSTSPETVVKWLTEVFLPKPAAN